MIRKSFVSIHGWLLVLSCALAGCGDDESGGHGNAQQAHRDQQSNAEVEVPADMSTGTGRGTGTATGTEESAVSKAGDGGRQQKRIHFTDVTASSGIDMIMTSGDTPSRQILEVNGGGLSLIDYDRDGDLDLFVANGATMDDPENGPGSRLFRNLGNLRFEDVTRQAGIDLKRWAMGATVGDVDGDGIDDIYITCYGPNVLLRNEGNGTFRDITASAGVGDPRWGTSAAFGDIDGDGDLDLYVVNYIGFNIGLRPARAMHKGVSVMAGPRGLPAQHDVLYENLGDGTFRDITASAGCLPPEPAYGLNVVIIDFNRDLRQDIYVGNDSMANFLFSNTGEGRFAEIGLMSGAAANMQGDNQATMGIAIADVDANGFPDLFTTNFSSDTNTLHLNLGGMFYDDRTSQYGLALVSRPFLGWACGFFDFDHDGDEDLLMFNGHVYPEATPAAMDSRYEQTPLLFERQGSRFERVEPHAAGPWLAEEHLDRPAAFGDLDGDGDIDVVVGELNGPIRLLRNDAADDRRDWLIVQLSDERDGAKNHRGMGSRLELRAGEQVQTRWIYSGGSFQSSDARAAHFGLADPELPLVLTVFWPDGHEQRIEDVQPGAFLTVARE